LLALAATAIQRDLHERFAALNSSVGISNGSVAQPQYPNSVHFSTGIYLFRQAVLHCIVLVQGNGLFYRFSSANGTVCNYKPFPL